MFHVHSFSNCMHVCIVLILFLITSVITFTCRKVVPKILFLVRQFVMKSYLTNDTSFMTEHEVMKWFLVDLLSQQFCMVILAHRYVLSRDFNSKKTQPFFYKQTGVSGVMVGFGTIKKLLMLGLMQIANWQAETNPDNWL